MAPASVRFALRKWALFHGQLASVGRFRERARVWIAPSRVAARVHVSHHDLVVPTVCLTRRPMSVAAECIEEFPPLFVQQFFVTALLQNTTGTQRSLVLLKGIRACVTDLLVAILALQKGKTPLFFPRISFNLLFSVPKKQRYKFISSSSAI
jgi:hypothetical protein